MTGNHSFGFNKFDEKSWSHKLSSLAFSKSGEKPSTYFPDAANIINKG